MIPSLLKRGAIDAEGTVAHQVEVAAYMHHQAQCTFSALSMRIFQTKYGVPVYLPNKDNLSPGIWHRHPAKHEDA